MSHDPPSEPWRKTELHCLGGFAVVHAYGLVRATADIDLLSVVPHSTRSRLRELAAETGDRGRPGAKTGEVILKTAHRLNLARHRAKHSLASK